MALYKFKVDICENQSPYTSVYENVGEYILPLLNDNGIWDMESNPPNPEEFPRFFEEPSEVGGTFCILDDNCVIARDSTLISFPYLPALDLRAYSEVIYDNDYRLKLYTDESEKFFLTSGLRSSESSAQFIQYFYDGSTKSVYTGQGKWRPSATDALNLRYSVLTKKNGSLRSIRYDYYPNSGGKYLNHENVSTDVVTFLEGLTPYDPTQEDDPYGRGGYSGTGGGGGSFAFTDEGFSVPNLPTLSATVSGFTTIYNPTTSQLHSLVTYMWTNPLFDLSNWKAIFANPMDAIIGLNIVPFNVPSSGSGVVHVGNLSTDVSMTLAASEWVAKDCGTISIPEYWGAYLDYAPYTKLELYLPFVGFVPLDADDVIGKTLGVVYHADIVSGSSVAFVTVNGKVHYSHNCNTAISIPVNGDNFSRVLSGLLSVGQGAAGAVVSAAGGNAAGVVGGISTAASGVMNMVKPDIQKGGSLPSSSGLLGVRYPFVCITRPRQCVPKNQNKFIGYPVYDNVQLEEISGYTEVDSIHLETIPATETELTELETLLRNGVIL